MIIEKNQGEKTIGELVVEPIWDGDIQVEVAELMDLAWWEDKATMLVKLLTKANSEALSLKDLLAEAKSEATTLKASLIDKENEAIKLKEEMTRLQGLLAEAEEKASLAEQQVLMVATKAIKAFQKVEDSTKNYWNPIMMLMPRMPDGTRGRWQSTTQTLISMYCLWGFHGSDVEEGGEVTSSAP